MGPPNFGLCDRVCAVVILQLQLIVYKSRLPLQTIFNIHRYKGSTYVLLGKPPEGFGVLEYSVPDPSAFILFGTTRDLHQV